MSSWLKVMAGVLWEEAVPFAPTYLESQYAADSPANPPCGARNGFPTVAVNLGISARPDFGHALYLRSLEAQSPYLCYSPVMAPKVDNDVAGKLVLITGGSGGIGAACVQQFAFAGADVAIAYSSSRDAAMAISERVRRMCSEQGLKTKITCHQADLGVTEDIARLIQDVMSQHERGVDILVSNAGYGKRITDILDIPEEEFDRMININLRASFLLVKQVVPHMRKQRWGRIVFVSSIAAYGAGINGCHYAASKAGLMGMMKNLSARLAADNISVNDVSPAMVGATGMLRSEESVPGIVDTIPLRRLCTPDEVANVVMMYATTGFTTGQSLVVAGGLR